MLLATFGADIKLMCSCCVFSLLLDILSTHKLISDIIGHKDEVLKSKINSVRKNEDQTETGKEREQRILECFTLGCQSIDTDDGEKSPNTCVLPVHGNNLTLSS